MPDPIIISPSVGRRVWVFGSKQHYQDYLDGVQTAQPFDGGVLYVHDDRCINVMVTESNGRMIPVEHMQLVQEGDECPEDGHARWMPYQTKQQVKHAAEQAVKEVGQ